MTVSELIAFLLMCPQKHVVVMAVEGGLFSIDGVAEYLPDAAGEPVIGIECELVDLMEGEEISSYNLR